MLPPYFSARSGRFYFVLFSVIHCFPSFIRLFILYVGLYFFTGFVRFYTFLPKRLCSFLMEETNQRPLRGKTCDVFPLRTPFCTPQGEYPLENPPRRFLSKNFCAFAALSFFIFSAVCTYLKRSIAFYAPF